MQTTAAGQSVVIRITGYEAQYESSAHVEVLQSVADAWSFQVEQGTMEQAMLILHAYPKPHPWLHDVGVSDDGWMVVFQLPPGHRITVGMAFDLELGPRVDDGSQERSDLAAGVVAVASPAPPMPAPGDRSSTYDLAQFFDELHVPVAGHCASEQPWPVTERYHPPTAVVVRITGSAMRYACEALGDYLELVNQAWQFEVLQGSMADAGEILRLGAEPGHNRWLASVLPSHDGYLVLGGLPRGYRIEAGMEFDLQRGPRVPVPSDAVEEYLCHMARSNVRLCRGPQHVIPPA